MSAPIAKSHWPLFTAAGLLLIILAVQFTLSIKKNGGHFVYSLDDPYIHMAIARNFARHGVWGVTRYGFSSTTSSLLWTLLLSTAYFFTLSPYVPIILNTVCALLLLFVANAFVTPLSSLARLILLSSLVLLLPLPPLIFSGMEHTAHIAVSVPLVFTAAAVITFDHVSLKTQKLWLLLLLATLAPMIRYESLFLILPIAILLVFRRHFVAAVLSIIVAVVPLTIYGLISLRYGSEFLPNPLLLKGSLPRGGILLFLQQSWFKLVSAPHLLILMLLSGWLLFAVGKDREWRQNRNESLILILATMLHLLFAGVGWFYRYEAYLIAIGILVIAKSLFQLVASRRQFVTFPLTITLLLTVFAGVVLLQRATRAFNDTIPATKNIYEQQYQMARFLDAYYDGAAVAANDIGAINFMTDIRCLDLWGLGSIDVTRAKLAGAFNTEKIAQLTASNQIRIALLYSMWFEGNESLPSSWIEVGKWTIQGCVVCGNTTVSFYAVDKNEANTLMQNLKAFSASLPADVIQAGPYYETR